MFSEILGLILKKKTTKKKKTKNSNYVHIPTVRGFHEES